MKSKLFSTLIFALAIAFSVAFASDKGAKTTKTGEAKKEMKGCCAEVKEMSDCADKKMSDCDPKEAKSSKASKKSTGAKTETKTETKDGEVK